MRRRRVTISDASCAAADGQPADYVCAKLRLSTKIGQVWIRVVEPTGIGGDRQSKPLLTVVKTWLRVGSGIAGIIIVLFTLLCAMELTRACSLLLNAERRRRRMSIEERARQS